MREFKFRAYNKKVKEMLPIESWDLKYGGFYVPPNSIGDCKFWFNDDCEIMQYTGLKDKKINEIYEGDIVKIYYLEINLHVIEFHKGMFGWFDYQNDFTIIAERNPETRIEIIGNIYQNPELLENK